ncbi:MAG: hypothetical protein M1812_000317 [Candelaria pacifica]|nr:MAG: hypothetical protein M1812_000317 [Candelaria pacifica]
MYEDAWYNAFVPSSQPSTETLPTSKQRRRESLLKQPNESSQADTNRRGRVGDIAEEPEPIQNGPPAATVARRAKSYSDFYDAVRAQIKNGSLKEKITTDGVHSMRNELEFGDWYHQVEDELLEASQDEYQRYRDRLRLSEDHLDSLMTSTSSTLDLLSSLAESFKAVEAQTTAFQAQCHGLLADQRRITDLADDLGENLQFYKYLEPMTKRLNAPGAGSFVRGKEFSEMLANLDSCLEYTKAHPSHRESQTYRSRYRLLLTRALTLVRVHFVNSLKDIATDVSKRIADRQLNDTTMSALLYAKFRVGASELKEVGQEIQKRAVISPEAEPGAEAEYQSLMNELYQSYSATRGRLVIPIVRKKVGEIAMTPSTANDLVAFARTSIGYIRGMCFDEYELWAEWFEGRSGLLEFLETIFEPVYDYLRPRIIHENHLIKLCELCTLLQTRYMRDQEEDPEPGDDNQLDFSVLVQPTMEDAQTRLVFRAQAVLRDEIENYRPKPEDLRYPPGTPGDYKTGESNIPATSGRKGSIAASTPSMPQTGRNFERDGELDSNADPTWGLNTESTPTTWYPTLKKAIWLLRRIYRLVNSTVFDDLAHQIVHQTTLSLHQAASQISTRATNVDAQLFLIKHLLILKQQIVAFDIEFVTPDISFDFSGVTNTFWELRERGGLFNPRNLMRFVNGGLLPRVVENMLDAKAELDGRLRTAINEFTSNYANRMTIAVGERHVGKGGADRSVAAKAVRGTIEKEVPLLRRKLDEYLDDIRTKETLIGAVQDQAVQNYETFYEQFSTGINGNGKAASRNGKGREEDVWDLDTFAEWAEGVFNIGRAGFRGANVDSRSNSPPCQHLCIFCANFLRRDTVFARRVSKATQRSIHSSTRSSRASAATATSSDQQQDGYLPHNAPNKPGGGGGWARSTFHAELTPEEEHLRKQIKEGAAVSEPTVQPGHSRPDALFRSKSAQAKPEMPLIRKQGLNRTKNSRQWNTGPNEIRYSSRRIDADASKTISPVGPGQYNPSVSQDWRHLRKKNYQDPQAVATSGVSQQPPRTQPIREDYGQFVKGRREREEQAKVGRFVGFEGPRSSGSTMNESLQDTRERKFTPDRTEFESVQRSSDFTSETRDIVESSSTTTAYTAPIKVLSVAQPREGISHGPSVIKPSLGSAGGTKTWKPTFGTREPSESIATSKMDQSSDPMILQDRSVQISQDQKYPERSLYIPIYDPTAKIEPSAHDTADVNDTNTQRRQRADKFTDEPMRPTTKITHFEEPSRGKERQKQRRRKQQFESEYDEDAAEAAIRAERRKQRKKDKAVQKAAAPSIPIMLPGFISVTNLAKALRIKTEQFADKLESLGFVDMSYDHVLNAETAGLIAMEYNFEPIMDRSGAEDLHPQPPPNDKSLLPPRPPIVTIMGHVDHGKTTLLDWLRKSSIAASEHGGITQHIGAFSVPMPSGKIITFLDTPGHAAFLSMRKRGANVTDIVILVVAADDSVKPQTIEAIKHAKAAKVPMIVAINKIDKGDADVEKVKQDLARHDVDVEDFGGDTQVVCVSGKTGQGMDVLEEAAVTLSEILDMRAETDGQAEGWILEATTKKAGRVATVLVRRGTLHQGDVVVAGSTWARVRTIKNEAGIEVVSASPGTPVEVDGWREQPSAGDEVLQAPDEQKAKSVTAFRVERTERLKLAADMEAVNDTRRAEQEKRDREEQIAAGAEIAAVEQKTGIKELFLIVKADVSGSAEAVVNSISALGNEEVRPHILRSGVGAVSEFDIEHAAAAKGQIVSFNMPIEPNVSRLAEASDVPLLDQNIIYRLVDDVKAKLSGMLSPTVTKRVVGEAELAQIFQINFKGRLSKPIAGCKVRNGVITLNSKIRVLRDQDVIYDGNLASLKNVKKDVTEMRKGNECGMGFENWNDFQVGDQVQCYEEIVEKRYL